MARRPYWFARTLEAVAPQPQYRRSQVYSPNLGQGETITRSYGFVQVFMMLDGLDPLMHDYLDRPVMFGVYWTGDLADPAATPYPISNPNDVDWMYRDVMTWEYAPAPNAISAPYAIQAVRATARFDTKIQRGPAQTTESQVAVAWEVFDYTTAPAVGVQVSYNGLALQAP